jgi:hypothetical protein
MPSNIQIGPCRYKVTQELVDFATKAASDGEKCWGWIEYGGQRIIIDPNQGEDHKRVALLHEVLHGVEDQSDQRHKHDELIIRQLAAILLDTLRRNPELVTYLVEAEP